MLMCLPLVTETLLTVASRLLALGDKTVVLSCHPLLAFFAVANAIVVNVEIESVGPGIGSSFPVHQLKWHANHEQLGCAQSSKFVLFFVQ